MRIVGDVAVVDGADGAACAPPAFASFDESKPEK